MGPVSARAGLLRAWTEQLRGSSLPWSAAEIRAASELRNLISVAFYSKGA